MLTFGRTGGPIASATEIEGGTALGARGGTTGGDGRPKRVFVTHGDPDAAEAFAVRIRAMGLDPHLPTYLETVELR